VARLSIFGPKPGNYRVQGKLTRDGLRMFDLARRQLAQLVGKKPAEVSDGDTIEFLSRGKKLLTRRPHAG